jgi:mannose-6-phosphate isomerase
VFLPAGAVHALGAGLLIAEIQQASDTTYRLFDWNRRGPDGKPRPLHFDRAIDVIDWDCGPIEPSRGTPTARPHVKRLVECDKFVLERWTFAHPETIGGDNRFHILAVLEGTVSLEGDVSRQPLAKGNAVLIPAECGPLTITPEARATLLDIYLP